MRLLLWFLLFSVPVLAQPVAPEQERLPVPYTLKLAVLPLLNPVQQAVAIQADLPLSKRWGLDLGLGRVFASTSYAQFQGETLRGWKLKPTLKYYLKSTENGYNYVALVFKYNNLYNSQYVNIARQGNQYIEFQLYQRHSVSQAVLFQLGAQNYFGKNKRWCMEGYLALGLRRIDHRYAALPPDATLVNDRELFAFFPDPGVVTVGDFMIGFLIGHRLF